MTNSSALELLKNFRGTPFSIPSSQGELSFYPLSTKHLQSIIETMMDSSFSGKEFAKVCFEIMKETSVEESSEKIDASKLNIHDRALFILATRIHSISDEFIHKELLTKVDLKIKFNDLSKLPKKFSKPTSYIINDIKITCNLPTLEVDSEINTINDSTINITKNQNISDSEIKTLIGTAFIQEISKYITSIEINNEEISFYKMPASEKIDACKLLSTNITSRVIAYIEEYKNFISQCLAFNDNESIPLDGTLFA